MGITHVVRGDDHLSNTPQQLLVLAALGDEPPRYAHLPLLHGPDGKKLSKRHGAASVQELRDAGYLPEAVRNYLALLGWGYRRTTRRCMTTDELVERFDVERRRQVARPIFDEQKLRWMNGRYMRELPLESTRRGGPPPRAGPSADERLRAACAIAQEKAQTLDEVWPLIRFLFDEPVEDEKARRSSSDGRDRALKAVHPALVCEPDGRRMIARESWETWSKRSGAKPGSLYQPIRVAITGTTISPGIFDSLALLGRDESLKRILRALSG